MDALPKEVLQNVAVYLPAKDSLKLTYTSKQFHSQLQMKITAPLKLMTKFLRRDYNDLVNYGFEIPTIPEVSIHTLYVSMDWKDQGWGNEKGRVLIFAKSATYTRVIYASKIAPHSKEKLRIAVQPKNDETYHLCYIVGDGGGHNLNLSEVKVLAVVFDDESKSASNAFTFLGKSNVLFPLDEMQHDSSSKTVLACAKYLLMEKQALIPPLAEYFENFGIAKEKLSLKVIEIIEKAMNIWAQQELQYQSGPNRNFYVGSHWDEEANSDDEITDLDTDGEVTDLEMDRGEGNTEIDPFQSQLGDVTACRGENGDLILRIECENKLNVQLPVSQRVWDFARKEIDQL